MTKGVWNSPGEIRSDFKCKVFPPSPFSHPTSCCSSENGTVFKEAIFAEQRWMLFLLQISRFFSRSNLICKWKWLYLPCRYRSYVGNSWKFMFWTYLEKKKIDPAFISGCDLLQWSNTSGAARLGWTTTFCEQVGMNLRQFLAVLCELLGAGDFEESTEKWEKVFSC